MITDVTSSPVLILMKVVRKLISISTRKKKSIIPLTIKRYSNSAL